MKPSVVFAAVVLGVCGIVAHSQQAGDSPYEGIVKDMLGNVEQLTKILRSIKDRESAAAARPELKKTATKLLDLRKKADELKQPSQAERDRLDKVYAPKLDGAIKQLREVSTIIKGVPGGEEAVKELEVLKDKIDKTKDKDKDKDKKDSRS